MNEWIYTWLEVLNITVHSLFIKSPVIFNLYFACTNLMYNGSNTD